MKQFKKILYVNESSVNQGAVLKRAFAFAENSGAQLTLVDVIPDGLTNSASVLMGGDANLSEFKSAVIEESRSSLESLIHSLPDSVETKMDVLFGKTYIEVIRRVIKDGYDLVVKPAENQSWINRVFGSTDLHFFRKCPCPVWIINPEERPQYRKVLAAVDFDPFNPIPSDSELNRNIIELATSIALLDTAELHVVHAWGSVLESTILSRGGIFPEKLTTYADREFDFHRREMDRLTGDTIKWIGKDAFNKLAPDFHLLKGDAKKVLAPFATKIKADIMVMGTIARTGISGLVMGNTAETILGQISSSVLAVKPSDFRTPVEL